MACRAIGSADGSSYTWNFTSLQSQSRCLLQRIVPCPQCGKTVEWTPASPFRPFCSERCKLIDLGAWASGAYRISGTEASDPGEAAPDDRAGDRLPGR